jgi:hypothetical protein
MDGSAGNARQDGGWPWGEFIKDQAAIIALVRLVLFSVAIRQLCVLYESFGVDPEEVGLGYSEPCCRPSLRPRFGQSSSE